MEPVEELIDYVQGQGPFTEPLLTGWRVGDEQDFICFDFLLLPNRDEVLIHSYLVMSSDQFDEDFLVERVPTDEALECGASMVEDAMEYLQENGVSDPIWVDCQPFIDALSDALKIKVH
jgi:hypothetical protein